MTTGVRQGCLPSPLLFLVALDWVARQAFGENNTGIQFTLLQKLEDLDFADDLVLLSQRIAHMRQKLEALQEQAARGGLKVNAAKSKEMRIRSSANTGNIACGDEVLEQVTAFTYLGSLVSTTGGTEEDVEARCRKAQAAFCMLRPVWRSKCISLWTKLRIFSSNVKAVFLYGLRLGDWPRGSSPNFRHSSIAGSGTSWKSGGQGGPQMRTCGSVQSRKGLKSPFGEGSGDGLDIPWGNLPQTSPGSPSSGTLKGPGRGADPKCHGEGQYRTSSRSLGCRGRRRNGLHKIESDGSL